MISVLGGARSRGGPNEPFIVKKKNLLKEQKKKGKRPEKKKEKKKTCLGQTLHENQKGREVEKTEPRSHGDSLEHKVKKRTKRIGECLPG